MPLPMTLRALIPAVLILCAGCAQPPHAGPSDAAVRPAPAAPPAWHWPADLGAVANMGFADDKAGDGVGGWSDQGWSNSFAEFEHGRTDFDGVPFAIADPGRHAGKAVVSFRHETLRGGPAEVTVPLPPGAHGRWLYLLHTACWAGAKADTVLGTATVRGPGGERQAEIRLGREVGDWWNPVSLPNGVVAVAKPNQSALVGVYLSRLDLGADLAASELRLSSTGAALWIAVGATLSARDLPLPERRPLVIAAGPAWKALPADDLVVKAGSALDRSAWVDHAPAGSRGRVFARPDGRLAFANDPATPVRFFGCSGPEWVFDAAETRDPEAFAEAVRLQGYNLVRFHFLDVCLAGRPKWGQKADPAALAAYEARAAAGQALDPAGLDQVDRLCAALKKRGIYLYLDAMTSWTGCYPVNPWTPGGGARDMKAGMYGDPAAREHYRLAVTQLLTHRNPLTGLSLAEDPMVAVVLGFNEQENNLNAGSGWKTALLPAWRAFLARRYPDAAAWRAVWRNAGTDPAAAPIFALEDAWAGGARGADVAEFLAAAEDEAARYMEGVVRATGYAGIFTHYDYLKNLRYYLARARLGAVAMHGYHAHPSGFDQPGSRILQNSALGDALGWWRGIAASRIAGLPQLYSEYGHVYWNRHRYEEGLAVGAYAALQDVDMLLAHAHPVLFAGRAIRPFSVANDPVARASQAVTGLAWRGGAVASARHRIDIEITRAAALAGSESAIASEQSRLLLLTGFAARVEGGPAAAPAADLVLPLAGRAQVVSTSAVSGVQEAAAPSGLPATVRDLRRRGILPEGNRSDPERALFESDTGEILLDARLRRLGVATPTLAGICAAEVDGPVSSGDLRLESASTALAATIASLDGRALRASGRLLLVLATDARNTGERYADSDGMVMEKAGTAPVLVRTGRFALHLRRDPGAPALRAWALAQDGTRRDPLAVERTADGLRLDLDSAAWACGPTPFIELAP